MTVMASVRGVSINGDAGITPILKDDMHCPVIGKKGNNFTQASCAQRIGNKDIRSCYKGCKEAAKYPQLKARMDKVIQDIREKELAKKLKKGELPEPLYPRKRVCQKDRATIVNMYCAKYSLKETWMKLKCHRSTVVLYRKMYREGLMGEDGEIYAE